MRKLTTFLVATTIAFGAGITGGSEASATLATVPAGSSALMLAANNANAIGDNSLLQEVRQKKRYNKRYSKRSGKRYNKRYSKRYNKRYNHRRYGKRRYRDRYYDDFAFGLVLGVSPWLYAPPVVVAPAYPRGGSCSYRAQQCAQNWSRPQDIRGCLRYYGC